MFLFAADMHLDWATWTTNKRICLDSLSSLEFLLRMAYSRYSGSPIVLGGDVFDTKMIHPRVAEYVLKIRAYYPDVPIYYICGNHDLIEPDWCSLLLKGKKLSKDPVQLPDGSTVCGIDFQFASEFEEEVAKVYPFCDTLVTHQTYDIFNSCGSAISSSRLEKFKLVLSGDYHVYLDLNLKSGTRVISPGSTNRRSIAEKAPTAALIEHEDGNINVTKILLPHRQMCILDIESQYEDALKALEEQDLEDSCSIQNNHQHEYMLDLQCKQDGECEVQMPMLVLRGNVNSETRKFWIDSDIQEKAHLLFSPSVKVPEVKEQQVLVPETIARGSMGYISDVLAGYDAPEKVKKMTADYFNAPSQFLQEVKSRFEK